MSAGGVYLLITDLDTGLQYASGNGEILGLRLDTVQRFYDGKTNEELREIFDTPIIRRLRFEFVSWTSEEYMVWCDALPKDSGAGDPNDIIFPPYREDKATVG